MDVADGVTQRINDAMDERRIDLGWKWTDVARRADVSKETVLRFRNGHMTPETTRKIERALGWGRGHIDAIAAGTPLPEPEAEPLTRSQRDEYEEIKRDAAEAIRIAQAAMRRLDELGKPTG